MIRSQTLPSRVVRKLGFEVMRKGNPALRFLSDDYMRHNARRLEHLASLRIPVAGKTVLEVGAGIGDHSPYYIDRGCAVTITEVRPANLTILNDRYPGHPVLTLDMEAPVTPKGAPFDVVHCYGLLYHLSNPLEALDFLSACCRSMMFLETSVSFGESSEPHLVRENQSRATQSWSGTGCRPTRRLVFEKLKQHFAHVYAPATQPNHEEFPLDWTDPGAHDAGHSRAVFVASRQPLANDLLTTDLPDHQARQG